MNKWIKLLCVVSAIIICSESEAADRTWLPSAGGSYEWQNAANWDGGVVAGTASSDQAQLRTTGQTGEQTINLSSAVILDSFYPGSFDVSPYAQIFTGESISPSYTFRVMGGNAVFENTVNLDGGEHYLGYVFKAGLTLRQSGLFSLTNSAHLSVGRRFHASYPGGPGALFIDDNAELRMRGGSGHFVVAYNTIATTPLSPGKVWQSGGLFDAECYWRLGVNADGYYRLDGGTVELPALASQSHRVGEGAPKYALLHISDGSFNLSGNAAGDNGQLHIGSLTASTEASARSEVYLNGGTLDASGRPIVLASWTTGASDTIAHEAILTVDDAAELYCRNIGLGNTASSAVKASLNLNGGLCSLTYYLSVFSEAYNEAYLNFNGGTLQWRSGPGTGSNSPIANDLDITVYGDGGTLDTTGTTIMTDKPFRSAKGYGVASVNLSSGGSDYGAAPRVVLSGGSGSNATAVAIMNRDGSVERVEVTCPGEGYLAGDTLTASFQTSSGYGSGASATVSLAENTPGTFSKTGGGTWLVTQPNTFDATVHLTDGYLNLTGSGSFPDLSVLRVTGGIYQSFSNLNNRVNSDAVLEMAGGGYQPIYRSFRPGAGMTNTQHFAALNGQPGLAQIDAVGYDGTTELLFEDYERTGSLIGFTPTSSTRLWMADSVLTNDSPISPSSVSPVVAGFMTADGWNLVERDDASGYLKTADLSDSVGADSNYLVPAGTTNMSGSVVNAMVFDNLSTNAEIYFQTSGEVEVQSGMILSRSRSQKVKRIATLAGGTLTTEVPGGMVIYDRENNDRREMDGYNGRYLISTSLADPASATPMAVTIAGGRFSALSGSLVRFMEDNSFSGGLYLANGGLWYDGDAMLGAAGSPVVASGYCALRPSGSVLETAVDRPIEIRAHSLLTLLGVAGYSQVASRIRGPISGEGAFLTGEYSGSGYKTVAELTGNNNDFTGSYYIFGAVRAVDGMGLSTNANIRFSDNTSGFGTLDMAGSFTRPLGDGPGEVCWKQYPGIGSLYGGFSAYGGDLTVNLHGDGRTLEWGSASLPSGSVLYLQNRLADGELEFMNGIDLNGLTTPHIRVSTDLIKTAYFKGVISDSVGGGTLIKGGEGILVLEQSPTFDGKLSILSGTVRLAEGVSLSTLSEVSITGDGKALELMGTQDV